MSEEKQEFMIFQKLAKDLGLVLEARPNGGYVLKKHLWNGLWFRILKNINEVEAVLDEWSIRDKTARRVSIMLIELDELLKKEGENDQNK